MAKPTDLSLRVLAALKTHPGGASAKQLADQIGVARTDVNHALYIDLKTQVNKSETTPPIWSVAGLTENKVTGSEPSRYVLVDLGNVHDCLEPLAKYAIKDPTLIVEAYADIGFKGYGVSPPVPYPAKVFVSTAPDKNAADVKLIWNVALRAAELAHKGQMAHFIFATKDKGFQSVKAELEQLGHKADFVRDWSELRIFIE